MEIFKLIIDKGYECFQWNVPFFNMSMWGIEISLAVGSIVIYLIKKIFFDGE